MNVMTLPRAAAGTGEVELSIVMPCLNEAETLGVCIEKANRFLRDFGVAGEVVIADNGSTDGSQQIAEALGARVVAVPVRGYGAALQAGIVASRGTFVAMADSDDSYDFLGLMPFVLKLRDGFDLVMGNRFKGGIAPGAMPPLHRYLGNPVLSFVGRLFYPSKIGDFHCGLRAFRRDAILGLGLKTTGMEFASEMVVKATLAHLKVAEVPTTLSPDGRSRPPHLRSWRDGWRHLKFLLTFAPKWLFFYPGAALALVGAVLLVAILPGGGPSRRRHARRPHAAVRRRRGHHRCAADELRRRRPPVRGARETMADVAADRACAAHVHHRPDLHRRGDHARGRDRHRHRGRRSLGRDRLRQPRHSRYHAPRDPVGAAVRARRPGAGHRLLHRAADERLT